MWLNYAFHSKHLLFSQSPLLLVSHLQEDGFSVIIWNAAEFYTKMRVSMWGIHKRFLSLTQQGKAVYMWENGDESSILFFRGMFIHIYLSNGTIYTNPVNESVLFTKSRSVHLYIKWFFAFNKDDSGPDELGFLPLRCIWATMTWSPRRASRVTIPLVLICVLLHSSTGPRLHLFLSITGTRQADSSVKISGMGIFPPV